MFYAVGERWSQLRAGGGRGIVFTISRLPFRVTTGVHAGVTHRLPCPL